MNHMSYFMRFPKGRKKAITLSYDDGVTQDARLVALMSEYGFKGTFNINAGTWYASNRNGAMSKEQAIQVYNDSGNEIAVHTYSHASLRELSPTHLTCEILRDKAILEDTFGCIVRAMAYPFGFRFADNEECVIRCVQACGIQYARTTVQTESFDLPNDWLKFHPTCHHNNSKLFALAERFLAVPIDGNCSLFSVWGHSYEFDRDGNWNRIIDFFKLLSGHDDIWYATSTDIFDYVRDYRRLEFNTAGTIVHNPTATDLWLELDRWQEEKPNQLVEIKAGRTIRL